jgi:branched-subunit amino acid transport protein AzlD
MIESSYTVGVILAMGVVTLGLRALPFIAAQWLQKHALFQRLGEFLPLAIMTLLLVHSLVGEAAGHAGGPWPEVLAVGLVVILQWYTRNALLSILFGTGLYVLIRNGCM